MKSNTITIWNWKRRNASKCRVILETRFGTLAMYGIDMYRWRQEDQWTQFVDTHFSYALMDPALLEKDKIWLEKCKMLIQVSAPTSAMKDNEEEELAQYIRQYVQQITMYVLILSICDKCSMQASHALYKVILAFIMYQVQMGQGRIAEDSHAFLQQLRTDIGTFSDKVLYVLKNKYWTILFSNLVQPSLTDLISQTIVEQVQRSVFSCAFSPNLNLYQWLQQEVYKPANKSADTTLHIKMAQLQTCTLKQYGPLKDRYALEQEAFSKVIAELKTINQLYTLDEQLIIVLQSIEHITKCVQDYWSKHDHSFTEEQLVVYVVILFW